jgi:hypothetical protein
MHKYFKEIDESKTITGFCSLTYKNNEALEDYLLSNCNKVVEISEKEYDRLRKLINQSI